MNAEEHRLQKQREGVENWRRWGPYLSERAWGTVREDYSATGEAWEYFPHDQARSRAYRWNEDGLLGICDDEQYLCFGLALWNGRDPILKERLFGLTGEEGNHGEDVKELYYFLDNLPSHAYQKALYKYPQNEFPYAQLLEENRQRDKHDGEFELIDTGLFDNDEYFDVFIEYAKAAPDDILIRIEIVNRASQNARLHLLPTLWFRNYWSWHPHAPKSNLQASTPVAEAHTIRADHAHFETYFLIAQKHDASTLLFTENETNSQKIFGAPNAAPFVKDAFHEYLIHKKVNAINALQTGTKAAICYELNFEPQQSQVIQLRLSTQENISQALGSSFDELFTERKKEADEFHRSLAPQGLGDDAATVLRQAMAGLLWSKQFYHYDVDRWLRGDPGQPEPPASRWNGRNHDWRHLNNRDVLLMPDTWEYPWYAAWDLAFHCVALSIADADFAKSQLLLLGREWYQHPNGQIPAYEWAFGDVNPPVHAWAALRVFRIERARRRDDGFSGDTDFLERVFHKLLLNFTWWVNRKDAEGHNLFQGGFLGLDNIGVFDHSSPLPGGATLDQADGTAWMAMYCLNLLEIALELARQDATYEDVATKFLEHFFYIAHAMNDRPKARGDNGLDLWDESEGFYYDVLRFPDGRREFLRVRSLVGLVPLFAVTTLDADLLEKLPAFAGRLEWFLKHRSDLCASAASVTRQGQNARRLFSVVNEDRLRRLLTYALDENEFLSPFGLRSVSRFHLDNPYRIHVDGQEYSVGYEPGESTTTLFGGNSNWRGPIWFPLNYLLIEALQKFDYYFDGEFRIECPIGSGHEMTLWQVSEVLSRRLTGLFLRDKNGRRAIFGGVEKFQHDPNFCDHLLFNEYFHGETGAGLGASHQTGWTALVAKLIQQSGVE
jgi:hypothetical protein